MSISSAEATIFQKQLPQSVFLSRNYPNPFNASTTFSFEIPFDTHIGLRIYNNLGQEIRTLADYSVTAGKHHGVWDGTDNDGIKAGSLYYRCRCSTI